MRRHIILEGPDGAGKTTLARSLQAQFGYRYHHEGPPPLTGSVLHHYGRLIAEATQPTVFDRLHLGELVYGPLLRSGSRLNLFEVHLLERLIKASGTDVIVCLPPWDVCLDANRSKQELIKSEDQLHRAYTAWTTLSRSHIGEANRITYDWTSKHRDLIPIDRVAIEVDGVIGDPLAKYLFVGEQPNGDLDLPFFNATDRSSGYLNERIREAGFSERDIAFTNALRTSGKTRDLQPVFEALPNLTKVIALGRVAEETCVFHNRDHIYIPHPQHWKRFHFSEPHVYTRMLEDIRR